MATGMTSTVGESRVQHRLTPTGRFVAIDFETADHQRDSACALGIVVVDGTAIVQQAHFLIRPPRRRIIFSYLHGISWSHVADQPTFGSLWPKLAPMLAGVKFIAAHNASFDRAVLVECCRVAGVIPPTAPFQCTVRLARQAWALRPAKLPDVCRYLGIDLTHHRADSDALACARIVIAAREQRLTVAI